MGALDYLLFDVRLDAEFAPTCIDRALGGVFDVANYKPPALQTYYVGWPGGSDTTHTGLSKAQSFVSISKAESMTDLGTISLAPGHHNRTTGRIALSKSANIIADEGPAYLHMADTLAYALALGATYTYKASRSLVEAVYDSLNLNALGDDSRLTQVLSYAGGDLNAGEWYSDGTHIYVRAIDSRDLIGDSNIWAYISTGSGITGNATAYLYDVHLRGGAACLRIYNGGAGLVPTVYLDHCSVAHATSLNGLQVEGANVYVQDSRGWDCFADVFNYHAAGGIISQAAEIRCIGRNTGWGNSHANNASTIHDACKVVRVGERGVSGFYYDTDGYPVADVNDGSLSLNYGCSAWGAYSGKSAWLSQCSGEGGMYLFGCDASQETVERTLIANSNGKAYTRRCRGFGNNYASGGGVITEYPGLGIPRIVG